MSHFVPSLIFENHTHSAMLAKTYVLLLCFVLTNSEELLTCIGCPQGFYYDAINHTHGECRRCNKHMTTFRYQNVTHYTQCSCNVTYTNATNACVPCAHGSYKSSIGNVSCTQCPANSNTSNINSRTIDHCECNAGYYDLFPTTSIHKCQKCAQGTFKAVFGDIDCEFCPSNTYCPHLGTTVPTQCTENSVSNMGSSFFFDCACIPGFYYDVQDNFVNCEQCQTGKYNVAYNQSACVNCPVNTYNPGLGANSSKQCLPCPDNSASDSGSSLITNCVCGLGYSGVPGDECVECVPGKYLDSLDIYECKACPEHTFNELFASISVAACLPCGQNKTSVQGSGSEFNCICDPGFEYTKRANRYDCSECGTGKFAAESNTSSCALCAAGKFNGDTAQTVCVQCADGRYSDFEGASSCLSCQEGFYQDLGLSDVKAQPCQACPDNSFHNVLESVSVNDCTCNAGFYDNFDESGKFLGCNVCEPGSYCPGQGAIHLCPKNHFSVAGAAICTQCHQNSFGEQITHASQCLCLAGSEGSYHDDCQLCSPGTVQPTNFSGNPCQKCARGKFQPLHGQRFCDTCPLNSFTGTMGSTAQTQCICNPQYYGSNGGPCNLCLPNDFCPGGISARDCPDFTQSPAGSHTITNCTCIPGFTAKNDGEECHQCPANFYCPGGTLQNKCSGNSSSVVGVADKTSCICNAGLWRGCILLEDGSSVNRDGACVINYDLPCTSCDEDVICNNNTLLHCPEFSTSDRMSSHHTDCVCIDGYYADPFPH